MKVNETMNKEGLHLRREFENMRDLVEEAANLYGEKTAYSYRINPRDAEAVKVNFIQLRDDVRALATEFIARGFDGKKCARGLEKPFCLCYNEDTKQKDFVKET